MSSGYAENDTTEEPLPSDPLERRRMMYRLNQRRHRERIRLYKTELENAVNRLTAEICEKSTLIQDLRLSTNHAVLQAGRTRLQLVRDFTKLFYRGFVFDDVPILLKQEEFLQTNFHSTMSLNDETGHRQFREQWILLSKLHESIDHRTKSIRLHGTNDIVRVDSVMNLKLSDKSFMFTYPQLRAKAKEYTGVVLKVPVTTIYYFQGAYIRHVFMYANFLSAWFGVVEDFKEAMTIVLNANLAHRYGTIKHQVRIIDCLDQMTQYTI